jgi:hypothetical protein
MTQTSVNEFRDRLVAGQVVDLETAETLVRILDDDTNMKPGEVAVQSTAEADVKGAEAAFTQKTFQGIAIWSEFQNEKALTTGVNSYADDQPVTLLRKGTIAVLLGDTVVKNDIGYFTHTTDDSVAKTWRIDLDTDKASQVPGYYLEGGDSGDIVLFYLDIAAGIGSTLT